MSTHSGPKIVLENLVAYYDFTNTNSYTGSAVLKSLYADNDASIFNSPNVVTSEKTKYIQMNPDITTSVAVDGTEHYFSFSVPGGNERTVIVCCQMPGSYSYGPSYRLQNNSERIFYGSMTIISSLGTYYALTPPNNTDEIQIIAYSVNGTNLKSYQNGNKVDDITIDSTMTFQSTITYNSGKTYSGTNTWKSNVNVYSYMHYDRALSDSEVLQNFNSLRSRYRL